MHACVSPYVGIWEWGRSFRNHSLWGRGKTEFQQEHHIRTYVGGEREECQQPRPVRAKARQVFQKPCPMLAGQDWVLASRPYMSDVGRAKGEYQTQLAMWAGPERSFRSHTLSGWDHTTSSSKSAIYGQAKRATETMSHVNGARQGVPAPVIYMGVHGRRKGSSFTNPTLRGWGKTYQPVRLTWYAVAMQSSAFSSTFSSARTGSNFYVCQDLVLLFVCINFVLYCGRALTMWNILLH